MKKYNKRIMQTVGIFLVAALIIEIILLLVLASQTNRYAKYWSDKQDAAGHPGELLYVALGDSVGMSMGASSPEKGYVGLIAAALREKNGREVRIINLSRSGATLHDGIEKQLPVLVTYEPDFVTVELGANDLKNWDEQAFRKGMKHLIDRLPQHTVISDLPYFGGGRNRRLEDKAVAANRVIQELAVEKGLKLARLHEITRANDSPLIYSADYFHPNDRGHQNWFRAFWGVLEEQVY